MCTLSGSGSTIFSMFYTKDIEYITKKIKYYFPKNLKIISCGFDNQGIRKIS
jgi:homoserine kinase